MDELRETDEAVMASRYLPTQASSVLEHVMLAYRSYSSHPSIDLDFPPSTLQRKLTNVIKDMLITVTPYDLLYHRASHWTLPTLQTSSEIDAISSQLNRVGSLLPPSC
eukprot:5468720-Pyramimonas_sp.AAC.2